MATNLLDLLRQHAAEMPTSPCLTFGSETQDFAELDIRCNRVANALSQMGVKAGDRVAILARNMAAHFEMMFGCAKLGAIFVPLNWRLASREISRILTDCQPALLLIENDLRSVLPNNFATFTINLETGYPKWRDAASPVDTMRLAAPNEPLLVLYTSGTTGTPKGVVLSHENLSYLSRMAGELWGFTAHSVNLVAMPLFHIGGIGYAMTAFSQGGHTVLHQQVDPAKIIETIRDFNVTHAFFVPTVIQMLIEVPDVVDMDLSSLEFMLYGGAPIGEAVLKRAIAVFGNVFNHAYGMTETAGTVITLAPKDHDPGGPLAHRLRSCGLPMPWNELALIDPATGCAVKTGDVGEIRLRSKANTLGYWNQPVESSMTITPDGWLCTGDAAYQDADGYVYIHDRFKDMIVSGGENIYPTEIENVLYDHPGIVEAAVIGVPHERWGETPRAYVVARAGADVSEADLIQFTRNRLARYKCPTSITFVTSLPKNAAGKILKRGMRDAKWLTEHT